MMSLLKAVGAFFAWIIWLIILGVIFKVSYNIFMIGWEAF